MLLFFTGIIFYIVHKKSEKRTCTENIRIKNLLDQSALLLDNSPMMASKKANEALNLSKSLHNEEYIIQSIELLGLVKDIQGETKLALEQYLKAYNLSVMGSYPHEICKIMIDIGKVYYDWGQYDTSLGYFTKAFANAEKNNDRHLISEALTYKGKIYHVTGKFDLVLPCFHRALDIAKETNDYKQIAFTLNSEGKYFSGTGDLITALQCYQDAYTASEKVNDQLLMAEVCNYLGGLYLLTSQYEKSLEFHKKALGFRDNMNNPEGIAKSYNNIGKAYLELHKTDSALVYFKLSLDLCDQTGYKKGYVKALTNMGKVYYFKNNLKISEKYLMQAFSISKNAGYILGIAESGQVLGDLYRTKAFIDKALVFYELSLKSLKKQDFDELLRNNYQGLYECYLIRGDYKKALTHHEMLLETEKKLLNVENNRQLAILQLTFNNEKKEKDNQVLRKDNELKKMTIKRKSIFLWFIVALLFSSILLCLYIYNRFYFKIKANQKLEELNKELNNVNEEKDKLFSIIAHELRNPLYWFQNLAEVLSKNYHNMEPAKIQKSLLSLDESAKNAFHLMDNLLYWSRSRLNRINPRKAVYPLNVLIKESLKMFETIIQYKKINLTINIPGDIKVYADSDLLSCVISNLVSNAIKYTPFRGMICIQCTMDSEFVTVIVDDTGTGIDCKNPEDIFNNEDHISNPGLMNEKGSGLGLKLCKEFVEQNGGNIRATMNEGRGARFLFTVPVLNPLEGTQAGNPVKCAGAETGSMLMRG